MYYYKASMYSPTLGRFMQTDPIGYGDGMNMYAFVGNDPVNGTDPTGLMHTETRCYGGGPQSVSDDSGGDIFVGGHCETYQVWDLWDYWRWIPRGDESDVIIVTAPKPQKKQRQSPPQSPDPETVARNQCRIAAVASGLGNASLNATGLIPGGRAAAVIVRTGATSIQATSAILGGDGTGGSITAVGFATELGNAALGNRGGQITLGSAGKAIAKNLPVLGTAVALVSIGNDAYNAYQAYQACSGE